MRGAEIPAAPAADMSDGASSVATPLRRDDDACDGDRTSPSRRRRPMGLRRRTDAVRGGVPIHWRTPRRHLPQRRPP